MKKINNIPQQGFVYNVINKLINTINEIIEDINQGVPQWILDLIDSKADKDGVYETLTAGNLVGRNNDATVSTDSFIFRTTGGEANLSDAEGKLLKIEGNAKVITDNEQTHVLTPFTGKVFKSYGFNHFNPIESNIILGHQLATGVDGKAYVASTDLTHVVILVRCVACEANVQAGYEITFADGSIFVVDKVAFNKFKPTIESVGMTILEEGSHRNSTSYLPTEDGWLAISLYRPISIEVEHCVEICVHICWSGYNDGQFKAFEKGDNIEIPYQLVHNWGLASAGSVRDVLDYEHKEWIKKVDRTKLTFTKSHIDKTSIEKDDITFDEYELIGIDNVNFVNNQISGSLTINITNVNDITTEHEFTYYKTEGDLDFWKYTEDTEAATEHIIKTNKNNYYKNIPTLGVWIIKSNEIELAKINAQFTYNDVLLSNITLDVDTDWTIDENKQFVGIYKYDNNALDNGESQINDIISNLNSEYIYYELNEIETGKFDINYITKSWDFGVEFFDEYDDGEIYEVAGAQVYSSYTSFLLDDIRALKSRDLQDKIKCIYIIESETIPTGAYIFTAPMTAENTLWHVHDSSVSPATDKYYQYNNGYYSEVPYKIRPNYFYIWTTNVTNLTIVLEPIANEQLSVYNEYLIQFTTSSANTPTVVFPNTLKWNTILLIDEGHTYQVSIVNNIGCIWADNKDGQ